ITSCKPLMVVMGLRLGPIPRTSYPGGSGTERKITIPDSGGQCLYRYSITVVATESLMPDTNTFGRGSINQSFIRPRTAGGRSFATTTSTRHPQYVGYVFRQPGQQIHVNDPLAERCRHLVLVITSGHVPR